MAKPAQAQKDVLQKVGKHIMFIANTNDIDSPSHDYLNEAVVLDELEDIIEDEALRLRLVKGIDDIFKVVKEIQV